MNNKADELIEKYNKFEKENDIKLTVKEDFICNICTDSDICFYAWDLYNIRGECLAEKQRRQQMEERDQVKIDAIIHYINIILWARLQWADKPFDRQNMKKDISEDISSDYCSYCKIYISYTCQDCNLKPNPKEQCCEGLWAKMRDSKTCGEFEQRATDVLQYICEEG